jgi:hypothetical protein
MAMLEAVLSVSNIRYNKPTSIYMKEQILILLLFVSYSVPNVTHADEDARQLVELPEMMQQHMMANMRDHLVAINEILVHMSNDELEKAAEIAESRLGMSSLKSHGASHMARFMPEGMRDTGTGMHKAASRFAIKAQEGEAMTAYKALSEITSACVECHAGYRIR